MLNKTVGYSGFRTYGELPYPTRKQGKQLELANKVWVSTVRQTDHRNPLENFHNSQTIYKNSHLDNTFPQNYHPEHVPKGGSRTLKFPNSGSIKPYDKLQAEKYYGRNESKDERQNKFLKTGTEHWKTNYQQMDDRKKSGSKVNSTTNDWNSSKNKRGCSTGEKSMAQRAEEGRAKSYKNKPYINRTETGATDYKFNYGETIGSSPLQLMNQISVKQPLREHPLKKGTNQMWSEIPNYQGFKPSQLSFKQYKKRIQERKQAPKPNIKLQVTDNFLVNVPGYAGYKPQYVNQSSKLRENCISIK